MSRFRCFCFGCCCGALMLLCGFVWGSYAAGIKWQPVSAAIVADYEAPP